MSNNKLEQKNANLMLYRAYQIKFVRSPYLIANKSRNYLYCSRAYA